MPSRQHPPTDRPDAADGARAGVLQEVVLVAGIVVLGLVLRGLRPGAMAIEHFDEGVYASNLDCGHLDPPFVYPMRHLYAPPLFPALLEWARILAGPSAVMWVNVLLGSLTVAAVWWATRCWFGRPAGIAAAMLAATSEYHIAFSRMALTDVPLSLLMLLGVFAGWRAILSGRPLWIMAAGALAGLAWCTKYNGWLTLAVTGSGTAAWLLGGILRVKSPLGARSGPPAASRSTREAIADCRLEGGAIVVRWGLTAAIAGVIFWVFVLRDLAPRGGYSEVAKNHAGYFVGFGGWWSGFVRQAGAHDLLMGWPTSAGIAAACLACCLFTAGMRRGAAFWISAALVSLSLALAGRLLTASGLLDVTALAGFVILKRRSTPADGAAGESITRRFAAWLLFAWFLGLLVATPLYYAYPRLSLPWVVACWPLAGAAIGAAADWLRPIAGNIDSDAQVPGADARQPVPFVLGGVTAAVGTLLLVTGRGSTDPGIAGELRAWQDRTGVRQAAVELLPQIESAAASGHPRGHDVDAVVYVHGDPPAFHHLSRQALTTDFQLLIVPAAEASVRPAARVGVKTFLVTPADDVSDADLHLRLIGSQPFRSSDLVLLDRLPASALRATATRPPEELRLYEVR